MHYYNLGSPKTEKSISLHGFTVIAVAVFRNIKVHVYIAPKLYYYVWHYYNIFVRFMFTYTRSVNRTVLHRERIKRLLLLYTIDILLHDVIYFIIIIIFIIMYIVLVSIMISGRLLYLWQWFFFIAQCEKKIIHWCFREFMFYCTFCMKTYKGKRLL